MNIYPRQNQDRIKTESRQNQDRIKTESRQNQDRIKKKKMILLLILKKIHL
jgi:hypothetical protein